MNNFRIPFGNVNISKFAMQQINDSLHYGRITDGPLVAEFEKRFAKKFGWKYAIATSSGTTAGEVLWSALRELSNWETEPLVITPACAFVATANCLFAARIKPKFVDVQLDTLNLNVSETLNVLGKRGGDVIGIQFVATLGSGQGLDCLTEQLAYNNSGTFIIGDFCEAHGARLDDDLADHLCHASIYSLYPAHLIVAGEGGVICTNDEKIAALCRSIKSHGRPDGSTYFEFQRVGFNAKWNELGAAIALDSLATFDKRFVERRSVRAELIRVLSKYEWDGYLRLFRQERGEVIAPHGFAIVLQDERADVRSLYDYLEQGGVECKTLWGSLPTQHKAFEFMNHTLGDFPVAERLGNTGLHFGCHDGMTDDDINHISSLIGQWLMTERRQRIAV